MMTLLVMLLLAARPLLVLSQDEPALPESALEQENDHSRDEDEAAMQEEEGEAKNHTAIVTPITVFPKKDSYKQALEELAEAETLWKKGQAEATSDKALEAYDDLTQVWVPKKQRAKKRTQRRRAATIYIDSSMAYIQEWMKKQPDTADTRKEARARLWDLRDVAVNYPDLNRKLFKALEGLRE